MKNVTSDEKGSKAFHIEEFLSAAYKSIYDKNEYQLKAEYWYITYQEYETTIINISSGNIRKLLSPFI